MFSALERFDYGEGRLVWMAGIVAGTVWVGREHEQTKVGPRHTRLVPPRSSRDDGGRPWGTSPGWGVARVQNTAGVEHFPRQRPASGGSPTGAHPVCFARRGPRASPAGT